MPWKICVLSFFLSFMGLEAGAENLLVLAGSASRFLKMLLRPLNKPRVPPRRWFWEVPVNFCPRCD